MKQHADKYIFIACLILAAAMFVGGFFCPPMGVIDGSVLKAGGILLGFAALAVAGQNLANGKEVTMKKDDLELTIGDNEEETEKEEPEEEDAPIECEEEESEVMDTKVEISKMPAEKKSGCSINSGILQFTGKAPDIAISLMKFLGDSAYKISVEFSEITEE